MFGRGHERNRHQGCRGGRQLPSFFDGIPSSFGGLHRGETPVVNPPLALPFKEEMHSNDDIFREIEDYSEEAKRGDQVQDVDPP